MHVLSRERDLDILLFRPPYLLEDECSVADCSNSLPNSKLITVLVITTGCNRGKARGLYHGHV